MSLLLEGDTTFAITQFLRMGNDSYMALKRRKKRSGDDVIADIAKASVAAMLIAGTAAVIADVVDSA